MKKILNFVCSTLIVLSYLHVPIHAQTLATTSGYELAYSGSPQSQATTLKYALSELESTFKVSFIYKSELIGIKIDNYQKNSFATVEEALEALLKPRGLNYRKVRDNFYIVLKNEAQTRHIRKINQWQEAAAEPDVPGKLLVERVGRLGLVLNKIADIAVSGKVTSETGEGLPGVNVTVKSTTIGTITDVNGNYRLTAPENATLVFSYIGYTTEEIAIGTRTTIDIQMTPDVKALSEVVVIGYGTQERAKVTGAISSISSDEINALPVASLDAALQGRAAGVTITNRGAPGTNPTVRIRG
nr:STN domain-containing protein [Rhodocytophaga rosea]